MSCEICKSRAWWGPKGGRPVRCTKCKDEGMKNLSTRACRHEGCDKFASYGEHIIRGRVKMTHCKDHMNPSTMIGRNAPILSRPSTSVRRAILHSRSADLPRPDPEAIAPREEYSPPSPREDRFRGPPSPSPRKVKRDIRTFCEVEGCMMIACYGYRGREGMVRCPGHVVDGMTNLRSSVNRMFSK